jgi:hypothetical protein
MFLKIENVFSKYAMDCGFFNQIEEGFFDKSYGRRVILQSGPLDHVWTIKIRSRVGREQPARVEGEHSGAMAGLGRNCSISRFRA